MGSINPYPIAVTTQQQQRIDQGKDRYRPDPNVMRKPRYGKITKVQQATTTAGLSTVLVFIQFDENPSKITQSSHRRAFVLGHTSEEVALNFGDARDLVGLPCRVEQDGDRPDQGIAFIINRKGRGNLELANTMPNFGTLMAPAGQSD